MFTIHLALYGNLIRYKENPLDKYRSLEIVPGTGLYKILEDLGIRPKEAGLVLCNGERIAMDYCPHDNDTISLYSLMSAG